MLALRTRKGPPIPWLAAKVREKLSARGHRALSLVAPLDMLRQLISTTRPQGEVTFVGEARLATQLKRWRDRKEERRQTVPGDGASAHKRRETNFPSRT